MPVDGLTKGNQAAFSETHESENKKTHEKAVEAGGANERAKTEESAAGRAIAIVPDGLDPSKPVDVLLHLHGYTSRAWDPYAGWRERSDDHTVRDVALDRIEEQIKAAGDRQLLGILPQGVGHSEFGGLVPGPYVDDVVGRLVKIGTLESAPKQTRLILSAHSGGGHTVRRVLAAEVEAEAKGKMAASPAPAEVVLFEAINNSDELKAVEAWVDLHIERVRQAGDPAAKGAAVDACPVLRAYRSSSNAYRSAYDSLDSHIKSRLAERPDELGPHAAELADHFRVLVLAGTAEHEKTVRGLGDDPAGGPLADALRAGHHPSGPSSLVTTTAKPGSGHRPSPGGSGQAGRQAEAAAPKHLRTRKRTTSTTPHHEDDRNALIAKAILLAESGGASAADNRAVAKDIERSTGDDVKAWFARFDPSATFLGLPIRPSSNGEAPGVHAELAAALRAAEAQLVKEGEAPSDAAKRLAIRDIAGLRRPKNATGGSRPSMHCFGMAVDIDHDDNPFLGNVADHAAIDIAMHATLLFGGAARDPRRAPPELGDHATASPADRQARSARAGAQWDLLHADSEQVRQYLNLTDDQLDAQVDQNLDALLAWQQSQLGGATKGKRKKHAAPAWASQVADKEWWRAQHASDVKRRKHGDLAFGADPSKHGLMTLKKELVTALVGAGLTWGGTYATGKDLMHFDLRTGSIGGRPVA